MLKIENVEITGWEAAIRGMRNPMNSWDKSDSGTCMGTLACHSCEKNRKTECNVTVHHGDFVIGPNDRKLMRKLAGAGTADHRKFMRMITVYLDITGPLYWMAEMDTYKVGVTRNSCSFMHKGVSRPFDIHDFSISDERVYTILSDLEQREYHLTYPYETDEYKIFTGPNGRTYRVYRNGKVIREAFEYTDSYGKGRHRIIEEAPATMYQTNGGYIVVKLSGRGSGHIVLHRLVAMTWIDNPDNLPQVDHIDGDKGNNCVENLRWVTAKDNIKYAHENGLYKNLKSVHRAYRSWKANSHVIPVEKRTEASLDIMNGATYRDLSEKYDLTFSQANGLKTTLTYSKNEFLFQECLVWENLINELNRLRDIYLETKDESVFIAIRSLLPQGYLQRSTFCLNYEVLRNIYTSRRHHRLPEWHTLCDWIETLPMADLITGPERMLEFADQPAAALGA